MEVKLAMSDNNHSIQSNVSRVDINLEKIRFSSQGGGKNHDSNYGRNDGSSQKYYREGQHHYGRETVDRGNNELKKSKKRSRWKRRSDRYHYQNPENEKFIKFRDNQQQRQEGLAPQMSQPVFCGKKTDFGEGSNIVQDGFSINQDAFTVNHTQATKAHVNPFKDPAVLTPIPNVTCDNCPKEGRESEKQASQSAQNRSIQIVKKENETEDRKPETLKSQDRIDTTTKEPKLDAKNLKKIKTEREESIPSFQRDTPSVEKLLKPPMKSSKKSGKKESSEEDVVCLGKLENKFQLDDDDEEDIDDEGKKSEDKAIEGLERDSGNSDPCILCDKKGHSSFECQMICKNCAQPYHNLKSCPKPANLSIMMQSFMEFCMGQLYKFNPEAVFEQTSQYKRVSSPSVSLSKSKRKRSNNAAKKAKEATKKKFGEKRHHKSDKESDSADSDEDGSSSESPSTNESSSDSSSEETNSKRKRKHHKSTKKSGAPFIGQYASQYPPFGGFGQHNAPSGAALNPMFPMYAPLLHGNYPNFAALNIKR